jgi:hypothetical protein
VALRDLLGDGPVAGMASRLRKSPAGLVSLKVMVRSSGVSMLEILVAAVLAWPPMPLMMPK